MQPILNINAYVKNNATQQKLKANNFQPVKKGNVIDYLKILEKKYDVSEISRKLESGKPLSSGEMSYLRSKHPELYEKALKIMREREAFERELKNATTKEQALKIYDAKMKEIMMSGKISSPEEISMRTKHMNDVFSEFVDNEEFKNMPNNEDDKSKDGTKKTKSFDEKV